MLVLSVCWVHQHYHWSVLYVCFSPVFFCLISCSMSSDLQWLIVRNNSSFLVKRNNAQFSSEAGNVMNVNSFKFNGLVNERTVDVSMAAAEGKKTFLNVSTKRNSRKPRSGIVKTKVVCLFSPCQEGKLELLVRQATLYPMG